MANSSYDWLKSRIKEVTGRGLLIVGDIGLDEYVMGEVRRISPEAPVPIVEVHNEDRRLGLAANVAANVLSLGGKAQLISVTGQDAAAEGVRQLLGKQGLTTDGIFVDPSRPTTKKLRVIAHNQQVVRVDFEKRKFLGPELEAKIFARVSEQLQSYDVLIVQDYAKGALSEDLCQKLIGLARRQKKMVLADPHRQTPVRFYRGANILKPNRDEAFQLAGVNVLEVEASDEEIARVGHQLQKQAEAECVVITLGKNGMRIFDRGQIKSIPTFARAVFDVTGAGDTVLAALALGIAAGWDVEKSCIFANLAAGVVVGELGCVTCSQQQILDYIQKIS